MVADNPQVPCEGRNCVAMAEEDAFGAYLCTNCADKEAEAAWLRLYSVAESRTVTGAPAWARTHDEN